MSYSLPFTLLFPTSLTQIPQCLAVEEQHNPADPLSMPYPYWSPSNMPQNTLGGCGQGLGMSRRSLGIEGAQLGSKPKTIPFFTVLGFWSSMLHMLYIVKTAGKWLKTVRNVLRKQEIMMEECVGKWWRENGRMARCSHKMCLVYLSITNTTIYLSHGKIVDIATLKPKPFIIYYCLVRTVERLWGMRTWTRNRDNSLLWDLLCMTMSIYIAACSGGL